MATNKEEVLFKVKAELSGFKKSMDELKKMAKETSNNVKKSMNMDLSDEGNKAGKSFTDGMNRQMKNATNSVRAELKKVAEQASEIKIGFDTSGIDAVKRQIDDISSKKISTASDRASASMSNNANAPNTSSMVSAIVGAANASSISKMSEAVSSVGKSVKSTTDNMKQSFSGVSRTINKDLSDAFEKTVSKQSSLRRKIAQTNGEIENQEEFIRRSKESLKSFEKEIEEANKRLSTLDPKSKEYADLSKEIENLNKDYNESKNVLDKIIAETEKQISQVSRLKTKIDELKNSFNNLSEVKKSGTSYDDITNKQQIESQLKVAEMYKKSLLKARESGNDTGISTYEKSLNRVIERIQELGYSGEKLTPFLKVLNKELGNTDGINKTSSAIGGLVKALSTLANAFKKVSINLPLNMVSAFGKTVNKMLTYPLNVANTVMTNFGKKMSEVGAKVLYPTNLIKVFGTSIKQLGTELKNGFNNISTKWIDKITNGLEVGKNKFYSFCDALSNYPDNVNKAFKSMGTAINNDIKRLGNLMSNLGSKVKSFSVDPSGSIKKAMSSINNSIGTEQLESARSTVKKFTDEVYNKFPGIKKHVENVKQSFSNMGNNIKKALNPINLISSASRKAADGIRRIGNESSAASGKVDKLKGSFTGLLGKLGMFFSVYQLFGLMKQGTEDAIKYESQILNIQRTFGEASKSLTDFANKNAVSWGISKQQVAEYGNIFSVIVKNINVGMAKAGASSDAIAKSTMDTTQQLLKSAGMISSALGYDVEYVLEGLRSGILGSSEAVDQFGLNLKITSLKASQAFMEVSNNGKIAWNDLSEAQRQYVITQEIINQTTRNYGQILGQNGKIMQTTASLQAQYMAQLANTKLALGNLGKVLWTAILPPLTKILAVLERVFNYAASALTALLRMFGIKVDFSSPASTGGALTGLQDNLGYINDTANNAFNTMEDSSGKAGDKTKKSLGKVGSSAKKAAKDTEEAAKKVKRALAGFDQINVLSIKEDDKPPEPPEDIVDPGELFNPDDFKPTSLNPGDYGIGLPKLTEQTQDNLNKFKDFTDKMKNLLKELTEPFKKAWDELGDEWIDAWNRLKKEFKNFCDSLAKFLKSVWTHGGKEFVQHMAEIALAVGIAAMEIGGTILHALAELWKHLDPETNGHTQAFLDALNTTAEKLRDLILSLNGYLENLMNNGGQEVLNALGDMFMDLGTTAARAIGVIIDAIQGLLEHLFGVDEAGQLTNEITKSMLEAWEYAFQAIGDAALAFADLLESTLKNGGQEVINAIGDLGMQILATLGTIVGEVADAFAELFRHMDPATNENSKGALEGFKYFVESITGFVRMLGECFGTFMDNGGQEFLNNVGDIVAILIDLASTIAGDIINSITAFMNSWAGQTLIAAAARALELISSVLKGFLEILKPLTPVISGVVAGILAFMGASKVVGVVTKVVEVFKSVGSVFGLAKSAATLLWGVLAANPIAAVVAAVVGLGVALVAAYNKFDGFREAVDKILDAFSGLGEALKSAFSNILKDVTNIFQDVIDIIVGIFTGDGERVGEAVRSLVENILQLLWDVTTGVLDIGINLITGLAKGIWEAIKQAPKLIGDALTGLADFIKDFFKGLFGIHSPSTVFAEYGGYLVEGLADGITKAFDAIGDAFSSMFKYIKDKVSKITDGIKSGFKAIKDFAIPLPKMAWDKLKETAGNIVNAVKEKVNKFKAKLPKPSVVWDSIKTTTGRVIDNVKRGVQGFKAKLPKPSVMWDSLKTNVSNALNKIKDFMDRFKWQLPKPKLPKFSVSGGEAPWGFMGKGSLPKVDIKWNKAGGIMTSATIFGMAGNTLLGGGEAGSEGIIPLDELWKQLSRQFQQQNAILSSIVASGSGNSNRPVNITLKINDIEMGKAVISSLNALSKHGGKIDLPI